ncbi:hypothetical protein F4803DRAFT_502604 [Xylaria telfairii]|nr:hypothetical protein F4803DRAFT_502604 [Xylaria telfairii]
MGELYWDPGNLLQITSDLDDEHADIQCVGRAMRAYGSRCRWLIGGVEQATVHNLILDLASTMPSEVSTSKLNDLAAVCLCQYHILLQRFQTVERWTGVVKRAAKQHEYLRKRAIEEREEALITDLHLLPLGGRSTVGEPSQFIRIVKDVISRENGSLRSSLRVTELSMQTLQGTNDYLEERVASLQSENDILKQDVAPLQAEKNDSLKQDVASLQAENDCLRQDVECLERENKELCINHNSAIDQVRSADAQMINTLRDEILRLGGEIGIRDQSLLRSRVELQEERGHGLTLHDEVTTMGQKIVSLEADISACWLHAFCTWINRQLQALTNFALRRGSQQQGGILGWGSLPDTPEPSVVKMHRD